MSRFKKINFWVSSFLPQKLYWHLAGIIHPWQAVLEDARDLNDVYERSNDITSLLEKLGVIDKSSEVLDIGCGVGRAAYKLAERVQKYTGVDTAPSMIKLARKYVKGINVEFLVTNGKDLKTFAKDRFNLVFSILVFQHLPQTIFKNYLRESLRVLQKHGKIVFQISIYWGDKPTKPPENHPWALRFYSTTQLSRLLQKAGFRRIKVFNPAGGVFRKNDNQAIFLAEKI